MLQITKKRIILNIFGIKLKFLRKAAFQEQLDYSKFYSSFNSAKDIPKATGALREFQETSLKLLVDFKNFCSENNLIFWLDYGTLLGAVRHEGFIPWDDDIDVGMMRDDYEKLVELFNELPQKFSNLKLRFFSNGKNKCFLKLSSEIYPNATVDIFPYDYYYKPLDKKAKKNLSNLISRVNTFSKLSTRQNLEKTRLKFKKYTDHYILKNKSVDKNSNPAIFMGVDFPHAHKNKVYDYNNVFPLTEIKFEEEQFLAPNDYKTVLTQLFGDYLKIPKNAYPKHKTFVED